MPVRPVLQIRFYVPSDRQAVAELLRPLGMRYPAAGDWVSRRLNDIEQDLAWCLLGTLDGNVAGVIISTPKGDHVSKLSTCFVGEGFQGHGLSRLLLKAAHDRWLSEGTTRVYGTVDARLPAWVLEFYARVGFKTVTVVPDRYQPGRDELVLEFDLHTQTL
jgi:GNAT superfamily N-acetyltransferase